jgi:hypothetical protein
MQYQQSRLRSIWHIDNACPLSSACYLRLHHQLLLALLPSLLLALLLQCCSRPCRTLPQGCPLTA